MICPACSSTDLKKLSFVYASGTYDGRGVSRGLVLTGDGPRLHIGGTKGTYQSKAAQIAAPPKKRRYIKGFLGWLIGLFMVGVLSRNLLHSLPRSSARELDNFITILYFMVLPVTLGWIFHYNRRIYPELLRRWDSRFMCQRCGTIVETAAAAGA